VSVRALLIVNPQATTTTPRSRDVLVRALGSELDLMVTVTTARGHATELAQQAADNGFELVVVHGGDGTVNEVINGLLDDGPGPQVPSMAIVPGGHANVLAYALRLPRDPVEATGEILERLRTGDVRRIGLARADDRWFGFNAGLGLDAEVVAGVDDMRRWVTKASAAAYAASLVRTWIATQFRSGSMRARITTTGGEQTDTADLMFSIVQNTAPWTMIGDRSLDASTSASLDAGIDLVALTSLSTPTTVRTLTAMLSGRGVLDGPDAVVRHDLAAVEITADRPVDMQVDGEHVGEVTSARFVSVPDALGVVAPPRVLRPWGS
jgi:diacylglycerol kinase family enzyme